MSLICWVNIVCAQTYFTNGTARATGGSCYRLTDAKNNQNGSVWYADKIDLTKPLDLEFNLNFGTNDAGADGIVFVMQTVGTSALGNLGGGIGFEGFSPSLGIEFDTYYNGNYGDLTQDHIAVFKNGSVDHTGSNQIHSPVTAAPDGSNIEDSKNHLVRITWEPSSKTLEIWFDCSKRITTQVDLVNSIFKGVTEVYWGFTSATGGANNIQIACLRDDIIIRHKYSICEGKEIILSARESLNNSYEWSPATYLSDAGIRNPRCNARESTTYIVTFKDACGNPVKDTIQVDVSKSFAIDLGRDTLLCNGSSLSFDFTSGYDGVQWENKSADPRRTVKQSGIYSLEAWIGECSARDTIEIEANETPEVSINGPSTFCDGESAILSVIISPNGQSFKWENGSTDNPRQVQSAGTYSVYAENGCGRDSDDHILSELESPDLDLGNDTAICFGDSIELKLSSNPDLKILWDNGSNAQSRFVKDAAKYSVTLNLNGCVRTDSIRISHRFIPEILLPDTLILCHNQRRTISSGISDGVTTWNNDQTGNEISLFEQEGDIRVVAKNICGSD